MQAVYRETFSRQCIFGPMFGSLGGSVIETEQETLNNLAFAHFSPFPSLSQVSCYFRRSLCFRIAELTSNCRLCDMRLCSQLWFWWYACNRKGVWGPPGCTYWGLRCTGRRLQTRVFHRNLGPPLPCDAVVGDVHSATVPRGALAVPCLTNSQASVFSSTIFHSRNAAAEGGETIFHSSDHHEMILK